jgi:rhodanese-related sulfurtransferase
MPEITKAFKTLIAVYLSTFLFVSLSQAGTDFNTIDTAQLHSMVVANAYELEAGKKGRFTIIDARPREEYEQVHIFSAISIPENNYDKSTDYLPADKNALLVVYCNSIESGTSRRWVEKAASAGYTNLVIYADSFSAWKENQLPVLPLKIVP